MVGGGGEGEGEGKVEEKEEREKKNTCKHRFLLLRTVVLLHCMLCKALNTDDSEGNKTYCLQDAYILV